MQLFYISNRPKVLSRTLLLVERFMPFISEVLVVLPLFQKNLLSSDSYSFKLTIVEEERFRIEKFDHAQFNFHLRSLVINSDLVNNEFIMSDDDFRPIKPIGIDFFKQGDQHIPYYFHKLEHWKGMKTSYDMCLKNTYAALSKMKFPTFAYSSHMPQIIDKKIFLESFKLLSDRDSNISLCEWSSYFNFGIKNYPARFLNQRVFKVYSWPDYPGIWPFYKKPSDFHFENYYDHLYAHNDLLYGLEELPHQSNYEQVLDSKIQRINNFDKSGSLPYMSYRKGLFRVLYPILNIVYRLYKLQIKKRLYKEQF